MEYYNSNQMLSHNCLFNFIVSSRGDGKTYDFKKKGIKRFINNKEQFFYIRRYKKEFKKIKNFFDDVMVEYPDYEFKVEGGIFYCRKKTDDKKAKWLPENICGCYEPLSTAITLKSVPFPNVTWIGFDEFITDDKTYYRYLYNEVEQFLDMYSTISRDRDIKVMFMANSIKSINPYFLYFGINIKKGVRFTKPKEDIICEYYVHQSYVEHMKNSRFGKLVSGTRYGKYAIENEFKNDVIDYIKKRPSNTMFRFAIFSSNMFFGFYIDNKNGELFCTQNYDKTSRFLYCVERENIRENVKYIPIPKKNYHISILLKYFESGCLYFENMYCKEEVFKILTKIAF